MKTKLEHWYTVHAGAERLSTSCPNLPATASPADTPLSTDAIQNTQH